MFNLCGPHAKQMQLSSEHFHMPWPSHLIRAWCFVLIRSVKHYVDKLRSYQARAEWSAETEHHNRVNMGL